MNRSVNLGSTRGRVIGGALVAIALVACGPDAPARDATKSARGDEAARDGEGGKSEPITIGSEPALSFLEAVGRFSPESLTAMGLSGHEEDIVDLKPGVDERADRTLAALVDALDREAEKEKDPERNLDIVLVGRAARDARKMTNADRDTFVSHADVSRAIYMGLRPHLLAPGGEAHAIARLRKYTGAAGTQPIYALAEARTRASMANPKLLPPTKASLDEELAKSAIYLKEVRELLAKRAVPGYEPLMADLEKSAAAYDAFVREKLLPSARTDFKLPLPYYDLLLAKTGVTIPREELERRAHIAYETTKQEMAALAPAVAAAKKWPEKDAPSVLRHLKQDQREGDALVLLYTDRMKQIEDILRREKLVTVPDVPVKMRLATAGETAQSPSPTIDVAALFKPNAPIDFLLPTAGTLQPGETKESRAYTDFTFEAASWVLASHEARPGHEMQFTAMKKKGLSLSRTVCAFNSTNVEGWGLYSERMMMPYMPVEGVLVALEMRALREARAFLDPELHEGKISPDAARALLKDDLAFSDGVIRQELDRYMYDAPSQATAYFFGYQALVSLREEVERGMKTKGRIFSPIAFHDAVLGAGLLPPDLLSVRVKRDLGI